jgi:hypothetical protein
MVFQLPKPVAATQPRKQPRLYSLYEYNGSRWVRISSASYYINTARMVFQSRLLNGILEEKRRLELRPIN